MSQPKIDEAKVARIQRRAELCLGCIQLLFRILLLAYMCYKCWTSAPMTFTDLILLL